MMKANKLSDFSLEQLESKKKIIFRITIGLSIVTLLAVFALFYVTKTSKNFALIAIAIGSLITLMPNVINIGKINTEIKSRKSKYL